MTLSVSQLVSEQYKGVVFQYLRERNKNKMALFVEGREDIPFYGNIIDNKTGKDKEFYICNGKPRLYQVYDYIENNINNGDIRLYFVDKDLSDILTDDPTPLKERLYITEYYSIENYMARENILERIIRDLFTLRNISYEDIEKSYIEFREKIDSELGKIMAWIIIQRERGYRPILKDKKLDRIIIISDDLNINMPMGVTQAWLGFSKLFPDSSNVIEEEINDRVIMLSKNETKLWLRGKYDLWAFSQYIYKFQQYHRRNVPDTKITENYPIQGNALLSHIFPRCVPSEKLNNFINTYII